MVSTHLFIKPEQICQGIKKKKKNCSENRWAELNNNQQLVYFSVYLMLKGFYF